MPSGVVGEAMKQGFTTFHESDSLERALDELRRTGIGPLLVVGEGDRWVGAVRRRRIEEQLASGTERDAITVGALASREVAISPSEPLAAALEWFATHELQRLPVVDDGVLVGVLWRNQAERYASLLERLDFPLADVVGEISPEDIMYGDNFSAYLGTGVSALDSIRRALAAAARPAPARILDFGCGHGRVLRVLKAAFPAAALTACDLDPSAVEFCARALGAAPVVSSRRLSEVRIDGRFDLVWSGSLLTHVDQADWSEALSLFGSLLEDSGVLVFSTAGPSSARMLRAGEVDYGLQPGQIESLLEQYERSGFGYVDYPRQGGYGISLATPARVARAVEAAGGLRLLSHEERAWDTHQDVVAAIAERRPG